MTKKRWLPVAGGVTIVLVLGGGVLWDTMVRGETATLRVVDGTGPNPTLPPPKERFIPAFNIASPIRWKEGELPVAAPGLKVAPYATGLEHPRWLYKLPNGDILVAESDSPGTDAKSIKSTIAGLVMKKAGSGNKSPNRIILLRDTKNSGSADVKTVFLEGLYSPFGMALIGNDLYVANANAIVRFPYHEGDMHIDGPGEKIVDLPSGYNHHWTKNILAAPDGKSLFVTVGSNSNIAENGLEAEKGRALIDHLDLETRTLSPYATGLRNPNGLAWEPETGALWVAVNERDEIGSDLVPDYITAVKEGAFYGWPYSYYGQHVDTRAQPQNPDLVAKAIVPDYAVGPHTASLGIAFSAEATALPEKWRSGLFVAQHGSMEQASQKRLSRDLRAFCRRQA